MSVVKTSQPSPLPQGIPDFIATLMRSISTARLYAKGHDLMKKQSGLLFAKLEEAMAEREFLFLGCAMDSLFLDGAFYKAEDAQIQKFLRFFHLLGISHVLLNKGVSEQELESFVELLAGARQSQGAEVSRALPRENITHAKVGLLDYSIFSTVQTVATGLAKDSGEEAIWQQLILQPAAAGTFKLSNEKIRQLTHLSQDIEQLKSLLVQMDKDMAEKQKGISIAQRGALLGNFIQNLGHTLEGVSGEERVQFARHVGAVLDSLEPDLKTQILCTAIPESGDSQERGVIYEIFQALPEPRLMGLLVDALKEDGSRSTCFNNLFSRAQTRYQDPGLLLALIHQEKEKKIQKGDTADLKHWQHLEQLLTRHQEIEELNREYHKEVEALATSIQMNAPMVEEEERAHLLETLSPESLKAAKVQLIIDLLDRPVASADTSLLPSLLENTGEALTHFLAQGDFVTAGRLLRDIYLRLADHPEQGDIRKIINTLLTGEHIRDLLENLMGGCKTYGPQETSVLDAICHLYPEKAGSYLLDVLIDIKDEHGPQAKWLFTALAALGPRLSWLLNRRLQGAPEKALPSLLALAARTQDSRLSTAVEALLDHPELSVRLEVITALGQLKAERSIPHLAEILFQRSWLKTKKVKSLQEAAARALAQIGNPEAREALQKAAKEGSSDLRKLCQELI